MPRQARIDTPGALHHIMVRGIERKKIFRDNKARERFERKYELKAQGYNLDVLARRIAEIFDVTP
jgi:REP element-mobilizing transposase RayT